jgi:hypothetical protein
MAGGHPTRDKHCKYVPWRVLCILQYPESGINLLEHRAGKLEGYGKAKQGPDCLAGALY